MPTGTARVAVEKSKTAKKITQPLPRLPRDMMLQEFSNNLQRMMSACDMSQSDLARAADTGRDNISSYVRGKTLPRPQAARAIAKALKVDINDLFPGLLERGVEEAIPSIEFKQVPGREDRAWLRINKEVSFSTAAKIIELINREDRES